MNVEWQDLLDQRNEDRMAFAALLVKLVPHLSSDLRAQVEIALYERLTGDEMESVGAEDPSFV